MIKNNLREIRKSRGLLLKQFEAMTGISFPAIIKIEKNVHNPSGYSMLKIAKALDLPVENIFQLQ